MEPFNIGKLEWMLSTDFGLMVFVMIFLTWVLVIVNLFLAMIVLVRKVIREYKCKK